MYSQSVSIQREKIIIQWVSDGTSQVPDTGVLQLDWLLHVSRVVVLSKNYV